MSAFGLYPILKLVQLHTKEVVETQLEKDIPNSSLTAFKDILNDRNFDWENAHEFCHNGKMYDVVHTETQKHTTIYYCYCDDKESAIHDLVQDVVSRQMDNTNNRPGAASRCLLRLLTQVFIPVPHFIIAPSSALGTVGVMFTCHTEYYSAFYGNIIAPPPRTC